ncbi:MAG: hypothetical protein LBT59_28555 [Clostridiales bacterium]|jgi:hypothetical protein|nr:hypothetical protein [Clostridiales bacterium]
MAAIDYAPNPFNLTQWKAPISNGPYRFKQDTYRGNALMTAIDYAPIPVGLNQ